MARIDMLHYRKFDAYINSVHSAGPYLASCCNLEEVRQGCEMFEDVQQAPIIKITNVYVDARLDKRHLQ